MLPIDINTIAIIVTIIGVGFLLERRLNSRINELRQDLLREMDRRFGEQGAQITAVQADITAMQADISELQSSVTVIQASIANMQAGIAKMQVDITELQKGQSRIEGAHEVMKDFV